MSNNYKCNYCKQEYKSQSSLNHHQKTAKFCLKLQKTINTINQTTTNNGYKCEYCDKDFNVKYNFTVHVANCKKRKDSEDSKLKNSLSMYEEEIKNFKEEKLQYEKQITELKLKLEFEQTIVNNLKQEIKEYKELVSRPVTTTNNVYNDNSKKTNYNIQLNQVFEKLDIFNDENIKKRILSISQDELKSYDYQNINDDVSKSLTNVLKDLTICTDVSRKIMLTKDENDSKKKMTIETFLEECFKRANNEVTQYLETIKDHVDELVNNDIMIDTEYYKFKSIYDGIKKFINNNKLNIKSVDNPLKNMPTQFMSDCNHIHKMPKQISSEL